MTRPPLYPSEPSWAGRVLSMALAIAVAALLIHLAVWLLASVWGWLLGIAVVGAAIAGLVRWLRQRHSGW